MPPTVSIITSVRNGGATLADAIESVLRQTYRPIEYIVIDGQSTDDTLSIVQRYRKHVDILVSEPDAGIYDGMNKGLQRASGEIIGFLNADDFYAEPTVIEQVVESLQTRGADCCYGDLDYVDTVDVRKIIRRWRSQPYRDDLFETGWHPAHPAFFARKSVYERYGAFDLSCGVGADYELMLRFLRRFGIRSCYIPMVIVKMRVGGKSNRHWFQIVKANIECYRAWKKNGLSICPLKMLRKPLSKVAQYFVR